MSIKQQTPQLRFTGFSEDWSNLQFFETLDSIVDFRGRTPKKIGLEWSDKGYVALSALNVKNGYIDFSLDNHFGDEELYQKWMGGKELVAGQVLFTTEAPMGNVAQVPDNKGYILSQRTIAFNAKSSVIKNDFLAVLLRSPATFNGLESMTSGGTAKGVSQKSMAKLEVDIPSNLQEQTAIGNLFQNIDQTIALQRRKHEQTQTLKKSLLSKMFPKKGQKQPEIRLKGFSGDWVEVSIKDTGELSAGGDVDKSRLSTNGKYPVLANALTKEGVLGYYDSFSTEAPAVTITGRGDVGFAKARYNNFTAVVRLIVLKNSIKFNALFLESAINQKKIFVESTGVPQLTVPQFGKLCIYSPDIEEQTAIGQFFKQLDDTISLQAKQLKTLENLKQALLAKMFV